MTKSAEEMRREIEARHRALQEEHPSTFRVLSVVGREDTKAQSILDHLLPDEPYFVFRAKDILSSFGLEAYLTVVEKFDPTGEQAESLVHTINQFRTWQKANPDKVKLPD